ncbi:MarR family transcriptional regulator [Clostridium fermenticellae]|uniref:HTH-type transcriptional regulator SarZ n=1 Tax=Clostridium fermenticellae TaxID=2068654 RepID=A0A386H6J5_9CLOT|nr:MarR family transcriptional regulator [Clostridium fermenticellae]AYD41332.1 MarR family transcriptional regulator [Clostridium fermenticellae]
MSKSIHILNELLVNTFNDILGIEQKTLKSGLFKDLSVNEIHTIEAIGMDKPKSMSQVASQLYITLGTLTTAINHLEKKGYAERNRSQKDRRVVYIKLTQKGMLAYKIHQEFHSDMINATIEGITEEEEKVLIKSLEKLNRFFKLKHDLRNNSKENGDE